MIKKLLLGFVMAVVLFVVITYFSIRAISFKPGFPETIILSQPSANSHWQGVDSVLLKASDLYMAGAYRNIIMGENYRKAWNAPIKVPVVWLDTLFGGVKVIKSGGGGQTRSLTLADSEGHLFTLRSVCKDATALMPTTGQRVKLNNMVLDGISAGHPYAPLPVAMLTESAGMVNTHPRLVFVPAQVALDTFNHRYGNRLFMLEYETEGNNGDWTGFGNLISLMKSNAVAKKLLENPLDRADQVTLLRARLFDLIIGDWDRHKRNWGWISHLEDGHVIYTPYPVDRDNAFYKIGGIVPWVLNRPYVFEQFRPFDKKIDYLPGLLRSARDFDPFFLNELSREDFLQTASNLQQMLTDEAVRQAFITWPDTIFKLNGPAIIANIISRRNDLPEYAEAFYGHLARQPQVMGTQQRDSFVVQQRGDKQVSVEVYSVTRSGSMVRKYLRTFFANETEEISLFGWGGDDVLSVCGKPSIPVNFIGGEDNDRFVPKPSFSINANIMLIDDPGGMDAPDGYKLENKTIKARMPKD
jgi:hypothetical protein